VLAYSFHRVGVLKALRIQFSMCNLTGSTSRIGVYTFRNNANTQKSFFGNSIAGSGPTYHAQPAFGTIITVSSAF